MNCLTFLPTPFVLSLSKHVRATPASFDRFRTNRIQFCDFGGVK